MSSGDNPYKPPESPGSAVVRQDEAGDALAHEGSSRLLSYAQLFLRLLGVFFLVEGIGAATAAAGYWLSYRSAYQEAGFDYAPVDPYTYQLVGYALVYFLAGGYFVLGGRFMIERILLPAAAGSADGEPGS